MFATSMLSRRTLLSSSCFRITSSFNHAVRSSNNQLRRTATNSTKDTASKTATETAAKPPPPPPPQPTQQSFAERNPFIFQLGVATAKTSAADIMVQTIVDRKSFNEIDWKRNGIFVFFGFAYLGGFQYWLMVNKFSKWFPTRQRFAQLSLGEKIKDTAGMIDALKMVAFDVFIHLPLIYFPAYYTCKEVVTGTSWNPIDWVKDGVTKYWNNKEEDCLAMIKLWGPSDCIQFSLPIHISMPFRHMVSFFWTAYVSFTRGGSKGDRDGTSEDEDGEKNKLRRRLSVSGDSA